LFQFLIGRLSTVLKVELMKNGYWFQFLIGRLSTEAKDVFEMMGISGFNSS